MFDILHGCFLKHEGNKNQKKKYDENEAKIPNRIKIWPNKMGKFQGWGVGEACLFKTTCDPQVKTVDSDFYAMAITACLNSPQARLSYLSKRPCTST